MKQLATLLESDQYATRWAAVRAMSQIGGPDSRPAADFMVRAMNGANEVEGYNMMIYFSLLAKDAREVLPAIQNFQVKNPVLPSSTYWAIMQDRFPWQAGGGGGGGGPGGVGGLNELMYSAYVRELGPRLAGLAPQLATRIMDNTAGEIPEWGYGLLSADAPASLQILTPYLKHNDILIRERAAVAIGYMGEAGAAAKAQVTAALNAAPSEREKRVMQWALRNMDGD
jgi:hypothetical protein